MGAELSGRAGKSTTGTEPGALQYECTPSLPVIMSRRFGRGMEKNAMTPSNPKPLGTMCHLLYILMSGPLQEDSCSRNLSRLLS